jgi:hypothetical protein
MDNREPHFTQAEAMYEALLNIEHALLQMIQPGQRPDVSSIEKVWTIANAELEEISAEPETMMGICQMCNGSGQIQYPGEIGTEICPGCRGTGQTEYISVMRYEYEGFLDSLMRLSAFIETIIASDSLPDNQHTEALRLLGKSPNSIDDDIPF